MCTRHLHGVEESLRLAIHALGEFGQFIGSNAFGFQFFEQGGRWLAIGAERHADRHHLFFNLLVGSDIQHIGDQHGQTARRCKPLVSHVVGNQLTLT